MESQAPDGMSMHAGERRTTLVVAVVAMIRMFGLFALLPVLSPYARTLDGQTPLLIGLAVGAYGLTAAFLQIPLGALSDRIGRLPVIIGGLAIFSAGSAVAGLADTIWGVVLGRLLQGAGAITATLSALLTDATRATVRTRAMAVFGGGIGISFMVALGAGPIIAAQFGVQALFWVAAVLAAAAIVLLWLLPEVPQPRVNPDWSIAPAFRADLLRVDLYVFLLHAIMTATFVALPFLLSQRLALPLDQYWKMYAGALAVSLAIGGPMIMKDRHQGRNDLLGLAVGMIFVAQLALTFFGFSWIPVFLALVVYFGGFIFLEAGLPARLSVLADDDARGASLGVFSSAHFLGAFVGGLIGGRFLGAGRPTDVFFVCALLAAIWLALQGFGQLRGRSK
ncbi:MAG: MFS transporter [Gammaproteobacteria bacterium]|nr:MFS transporter [Gammaproteobacteria bacterium]MBT8094010.1 MFS transporter [Gammaproteobacteria bacterium]MBT8104033.1 MFS transporter [Gammaproteobacteria bacterium]NNK24048.1 MFS transporter [Woeseiaceae bacterium]